MSEPGPQQNPSWRRLSARMLLVHPVREVGQAIPALIGLVVAGRAVGDGQMWWLAPLGVVVVIANARRRQDDFATFRKIQRR